MYPFFLEYSTPRARSTARALGVIVPVLLAVQAACSSTSTAPPAGAPDASVVASGDAGAVEETHTPDAAPLSPLFGPCATKEDCAGALQCEQAWPGGKCTTRCKTSSECGPTGSCFSGTCYPKCTSDLVACAPGSACFSQLPTPICYPSCGPTDPSVPACVPGHECNTYTGLCASPPIPTRGGDTGAPCKSGADCRSQVCLQEGTAEADQYGYIGGYCSSYSPAISSSVPTGPDAPRGHCPEGSVMMPHVDDIEGIVVTCFKACTADAQCRPGYQCERLLQEDGSWYYSTGGCYPLRCRSADDVCPAGYACAPFASDPSSARCVRRSADGDAGSDAGTGDASDGGVPGDAAVSSDGARD